MKKEEEKASYTVNLNNLSPVKERNEERLEEDNLSFC